MGALLVRATSGDSITAYSALHWNEDWVPHALIRESMPGTGACIMLHHTQKCCKGTAESMA